MTREGAGRVELLIRVADTIEFRCCEERLKQLENDYAPIIVLGKSADFARGGIHCGLGCLHERRSP